jgi:hypothetical protein
LYILRAESEVVAKRVITIRLRSKVENQLRPTVLFINTQLVSKPLKSQMDKIDIAIRIMGKGLDFSSFFILILLYCLYL